MTYPIGAARGLIRRRVLLNYRVRPDLLAALLPAPFRPRLVDGWALVGVCAIRLEHLRPDVIPLPVGFSSENAAHRFAVEWTAADGQTRPGVYIPRRDTDSSFTTFAGGRLFPGLHGQALFHVREDAGGRIQLRVVDWRGLLVAMTVRPASALPPTTRFASLEVASAFFASGRVGYSASARPGELDGLALETDTWSMEPLAVEHAYARELIHLFPVGALEVDSALLMRNIEHRWRRVAPLLVGPPAAPALVSASPDRGRDLAA
jgi:hypothetical protein